MTSIGVRLLTTAVLLPVFVAALLIGGIVFLGAVVVIVVVAATEFYGLAAGKPYRARTWPGLLLAAGFPLAFYWAPGDAQPAVALAAAGVIGVGAAQMLDGSENETIASVGFTLLGAIYVGLLLGHMVLVRELPRLVFGAPARFGAALLAVPLVLTWINDTAAYFAGHRWGRRRLLPRVSPGKTVEGALAGLVATLVAAVLVCAAVDRLAPVFGLGHALAIGLLVGVMGPCGDLVESAFKRDAGVKDVSRLVPGHGGFLDRFDSMLFTVPLYYYYVRGVVL